MSDPDDITGIASTTPRHSVGSIGVLSYSSGSSVSPSNVSTNSAKSAINECLGAWLNYLQVRVQCNQTNFWNKLFCIHLQILNNLCASGYRLAQAIATLEQWGAYLIFLNELFVLILINLAGTPAQPQAQSNQTGQNSQLVATQFINAWDDLAR